VGRRQLLGLGLSDEAIDHSVATGRLYPIFRAAFAVGHSRIGSHGRMLAAVLACGEGTVVSHGTAAFLLGLWDRPPKLIDAIAPIESGRKIDGIRRRHVLPPSAAEVEVRAAIPCTSPSRTMADLAGVSGTQSLRRTVERAAVLGLLDVPAIDATLGRRRRRGSPKLRMVLDDWRGQDDSTRLRSELEARLLALIVAEGLPAPLCNQIVKAAGRSMEVDLLWPDRKLIVEADGRRFHDHTVAFDRDRRRDRDLGRAGYRTLRVTWQHLEQEPGETIAAIRDGLTD
jgi:hypothetical protein